MKLLDMGYAMSDPANLVASTLMSLVSKPLHNIGAMQRVAQNLDHLMRAYESH